MPEMKPQDEEEVKKRAEKMVRSSLLLREVAVKEKITLDEGRYQTRLETIATQLGRNTEETEKLLQGRGMVDKIKDEILTDQVFEFLIAKAKIRN